jgi:Glycosyl transferase family 11.
MKYVAVTLKGGLGNQMFQYAAARSLAYRSKGKLLLDISEQSVDSAMICDGIHILNLDHFNISGEFVTKEKYKYLFSPSRLNRFWKALVKLKLTRNWKFITEPAEFYRKFDPDLYDLTTRDNVWLLNGFWQNAGYFSDITSLLRKEFALREALAEQNRILEQEILATQSVGIHIRRGDMVKVPIVNESFGVLGLDYYYEAVRKLADAIDHPHFFVFSDEPEWAENNFKIASPTTIVKQNNVNQAYLDLHLMSKCKHHILANSTFSWWAAWLGQTPAQRVIAPQKPFRTFDIPISEYYLPGWETI